MMPLYGSSRQSLRSIRVGGTVFFIIRYSFSSCNRRLIVVSCQLSPYSGCQYLGENIMEGTVVYIDFVLRSVFWHSWKI